MPWPLILIGEAEWKRRRSDYTLTVGHCVYASWIIVPDQHGEDDWRKKELGSRYWSLPNSPEKPRRAPIMICLPDDSSSPTIWCPDCMAWSAAQGSHGHGWEVNGTLPNVTITPSINYPGRFHSYVRDGMVEDDVEGRKFNPCGTLLPSSPPSDGDSSKDATGSHPSIPGVSPSGLHKRPPIPPGT
jgi:hypothetical protein